MWAGSGERTTLNCYYIIPACETFAFPVILAGEDFQQAGTPAYPDFSTAGETPASPVDAGVPGIIYFTPLGVVSGKTSSDAMVEGCGF